MKRTRARELISKVATLFLHGMRSELFRISVIPGVDVNRTAQLFGLIEPPITPTSSPHLFSPFPRNIPCRYPGYGESSARQIETKEMLGGIIQTGEV